MNDPSVVVVVDSPLAEPNSELSKHVRKSTELVEHNFGQPFESIGRTGRNSPCVCGSGRKFKHCCLPKMKGDS